MPDVGEPKVVSDERAKLGRARIGRQVVWRTLLSDVDGRKFCWWLLSTANMYSSTFRGEETHMSAFFEGQRALMIPIQQEMIESSARDYIKMVTEHAAKSMVEKLEEQDGRDDTDN